MAVEKLPEVNPPSGRWSGRVFEFTYEHVVDDLAKGQEFATQLQGLLRDSRKVGLIMDQTLHTFSRAIRAAKARAAASASSGIDVTDGVTSSRRGRPPLVEGRKRPAGQARNNSGLLSIIKRLLRKNPTWRRITVNKVADNDVHVEMGKLDIIKEAIEESLGSVNLLLGGGADKQVRKYNGGMKRRLSVAISLIGDAKVVYMDEPSTRLDPSSSKSLWTAVKQAKQDRGIILTNVQLRNI
ncbi:ABC transporter A family member 8 [Hordeum vulgare]|nr:ABC transporter A family member 8 [Hordeum vulgare]